MKKDINIVKIGKIAGECYNDFKDVFVGLSDDCNHIDIICAVNESDFSQDFINNLQSKISVRIASQYGTKFVEDFCKISIIKYL